MKNKVTIAKHFTFDSAHYLPGYHGKCSQMHGHTYKLEVGVRGEIKSNGMVMDFADLKKVVNKILENLDHKILNEVDYPSFPTNQPTAENMVLWFRDILTAEMYVRNWPAISFIRLWETPTSYATWIK